MSARVRVTALLLVSLAALAALPHAAGAAIGPPVIGVDAAPVSTPDSEVAYVTRRVDRGTRLIETARSGLGVLRSLRLGGDFAVPVVAYDGSAGGLSWDGRTLVLIDPRNSLRRRRTTLAVVDPRGMRLRRVLRLRGSFSFDAISPNGGTMYLIQYLSPRDVTSYAVRAYDMRAGRLLPGRVVDPSEPDEDMSGFAMTRATGEGGRWEYTLYDGSEHPFIHALDTERRRAVCIDMDMLAGRRNGLADLKLNPSGGRLDVLAGTKVVARIDIDTHEPVSLRRVVRRPAPEDAGVDWLFIAAPTAALVLLAAAAVGARPARGADAPRARGLQADRPRNVERRDRRRARGVGDDREDSRRAHADEARGARPRAGGRARL